VRARVSLTAYIWLAYSSAALLLLALVAIMRVPVFALPEDAWLFMAALALGPQLIGHTSFNWALRRLTATFVAVAILGEPVGAALLAWLFFGERFSVLQLIGFVALLGGIFVAAREEKRSAVPL
jgi:drug/metabolite transporter (DMT)-like permease